MPGYYPRPAGGSTGTIDCAGGGGAHPSHHAERCIGVVGLCVPYLPQGFAVETVVAMERPAELNAGLARWMAQRFPEQWIVARG